MKTFVRFVRVGGLLFALTSSVLSGCARPDYISTHEVEDYNDAQQAEPCRLQFQALGICVAATWLTAGAASSPTSTGYNELSLELTGDVSSFDELTAILWMPSMGHGSAPVEVTRVSATKILLSKVFFIMPGDWEIRLGLNKNQTLVDSLSIPVRVP